MSHVTTLKDSLYLDPKKASKAILLGLVLAVLGLGSAGVYTFADPSRFKHFFHAYLLSYVYFLSISLGALFFVILQHLVRAGWSVTVRRVAELLAGELPLFLILSLPLVVPMLQGNADLYIWVDHDLVAHDHLLHRKVAYLNVPFFVIRLAVYFTFWIVAARYFLRNSTAQDTSGDPTLTVRMQSVSAPAMILFGLTATFAAFDLLMSLSPTWFSTIFGVYFFAGCVMSFFASMIVVLRVLQRRGYVRESVTTEHFHDLGKLLFAFVFFWGYIAFSQFMLIWYANIPEETEWFKHRIYGNWGYVSLLLLFGHFIVPFLGLISRHVKRHRTALVCWAVFLLFMHGVDLYWIIMPSFDAHQPPFGFLEIACWLGFAGLYWVNFVVLAKKRSLVPLQDPRLHEALAFENF